MPGYNILMSVIRHAQKVENQKISDKQNNGRLRNIGSFCHNFFRYIKSCFYPGRQYKDILKRLEEVYGIKRRYLSMIKLISVY